MENLAETLGIVAMLLEVLWECDNIRVMLAKMRLQIPHFERIRTQTRYDRSP